MVTEDIDQEIFEARIQMRIFIEDRCQQANDKMNKRIKRFAIVIYNRGFLLDLSNAWKIHKLSVK